jgi:Bacterial PH domain
VAARVFRPLFVRVLSVVVWVLLAGFVVLGLQDGVRGVLVALAPAALVALVVYTLFWRPCVRVDDDGVTLVNLVRDVRVPFRALDAVGTRFALTLEARGRRYTAWAAPAPGRTSSMGLARRDAMAMEHLTAANLAEGVRASSAPNTDSGGAALLVQDAWSRWQSAPRAGGGVVAGADDADDAVTMRVATHLVIGLAALIAASAATVLLA